MDTRFESEFIKQIAERVIEKVSDLQELKSGEITICYLESEHDMKKNGRAVLGQCEKIPEKYKWAIPYDFSITIFQGNCIGLNDKQLEILVEHELRHISRADDGKWGIAPHDIEDFRSIIDAYGIDWSDTKGQGGI